MVITAARKLTQGLLDLVIPPACLNCQAAVEKHGQICGDCWKHIHLIGKYKCMKCGLPFEIDLGKRAKCPDCLHEKPKFNKVISVCKYEDIARKLAVRLKFGDKTNLAPYMANMMANMGRELLEKTDVIAPIPLHWRRRFFRKYNQSALLAAEIAKITGKPYAPNLLKRTKRTTPQTTLSKVARKKNVRGAFVASSSANIKDKRILLIDDVMTTGATISSAAKVLKNLGAKKVYGLTFARVCVRN